MYIDCHLIGEEEEEKARFRATVAYDLSLNVTIVTSVHSSFERRQMLRGVFTL